MLHTKFCGNRSTGSREEDFWRVFTIYGRGSHIGHVTSIMSINFHFLESESLHIKFIFDWPSGFWEKPVLSFICNWLWVKVKKWPWPSYSHIFIILCNFRSQAAKVLKINSFHFFLQKSLSYQIWPCRKIGQGQPRIIIWTNYDKQESSMLHTKFHGNRSTGSREEDFWRVLTIYGHGSHLGHVTSIMSINYHFLVPESLHVKFGFYWPSGFWEKQVLSFVCKWPWAKVKKWPWPSILTYVHFFSLFQVTGFKCSEKSTVFTFSYRKA